MRREELREICENEGFVVDFGDKCIVVYSKHTIEMAITIYEEKICSLDIDFPNVNELEDRNTVLYACIDYASTPIEERVGDTKYKLYHRYMTDDLQRCQEILTLDQQDCLTMVRNEGFIPSCRVAKNEFTKKEIEQIKERYKTTLDDFDIYEVDEFEDWD